MFLSTFLQYLLDLPRSQILIFGAREIKVLEIRPLKGGSLDAHGRGSLFYFVESIGGRHSIILVLLLDFVNGLIKSSFCSLSGLFDFVAFTLEFFLQLFLSFLICVKSLQNLTLEVLLLR